MPKGGSVNPKSQCRTQRGYWRNLGLRQSQLHPNPTGEGMEGRKEWRIAFVSPRSRVKECTGITSSMTLMCLSVWWNLSKNSDGDERKNKNINLQHAVSVSDQIASDLSRLLSESERWSFRPGLCLSSSYRCLHLPSFISTSCLYHNGLPQACLTLANR